MKYMGTWGGWDTFLSFLCDHVQSGVCACIKVSGLTHRNEILGFLKPEGFTCNTVDNVLSSLNLTVSTLKRF